MSVAPPHHINFMSTEGLVILLERAGFEILNIETPGELDVDIVENMLNEFEKRRRFIRKIQSK